MSTKALKSQLLAAVAMVLVSSIALGSSTYAWFAINTKVTATGMAVKTQVSNNLFIAADTTASTSAVADADFKTSLVQNLDATLEPVSTTNGVDYFYNSTGNAGVDGNALSESYKEYSSSTLEAFNTNYQTSGAVGYVDYAFRLKAINTGNTDQKVVLTGLNLVYGTTDTNAGFKAFRAGLFVQDLNTNPGTQGAGADVANSDLKGVYAPTGFEYQESGKAVISTTATGAYTYSINSADNSEIGTVPAGKTYYYKVVVRLWLEGEDKMCTSTTFAALTDEWAMDVALKLQANTTGAAALLNASTTAGKTNLTDPSAAEAVDTVAFSINNQSYYEITGKTLGTDKLYTTVAGAVTSASKIYVIQDGQYPIEVTNQCILPAPTPTPTPDPDPGSDPTP